MAIEQRRLDDADALLTRMKAMTSQIFPPARLILLEMQLRVAQRRPDDVRQLIAKLTPWPSATLPRHVVLRRSCSRPGMT
ncbi:hypothetical protein FPZ54_13870 [Sphingomonas suaedae]|uniref:Uncharacterized protein n=1 Tax=Sphingomonas suaedae TaxID=2599297 RepID=A0A518RHR5_9SPHN|nr:hypothetical protein [Sphingomonas suaedae]QDX26982.1 hypothetical protein FPZ54_13870 [Sphingomonas suaedae]